MLKGRTALIPLLSAALLVVGVSSCRKNRPPDVPAVPTGPDICFKDSAYSFTTTVTDPDGDSVSVRFVSTDGSESNWSGWFASRDTVALTYAWSDTGTYEVRAEARDQGLRMSGWSGPLIVQVVLRRPPYTPAAPTGPDKGGQDSSYSFAAAAFHPDNVNVSIRFSWGDDDTTDWSPYVASGETVRMSHAWTAPGTYAVAAQAKDTGNTLSQWSTPDTLIIRPPDTLLLWRVRLGAGNELSSSPAIAPDGTIYVGSLDSGVYAVSPSGTVRWRYETGGPVYSSPAIAPDGTIYVGSSDSSLYAINSNGTQQWCYQTGGGVASSPSIASDGTIYVGSDDHKLYAFNSNGTERWIYLTGGSVSSSPAVAANGTVYICSHDRYLHAVNPDGTPRWSYNVGPVYGTPTPAIGADGTIYCGAAVNESWALCALNPDGSLRWVRSTSSYDEVSASPAVAADGAIYVAAMEGFYALNPDSTLRWWFRPTGPTFNSSPAVSSDGTIYFGSYFFYYALRLDGSIKWYYTRGLATVSSPSIGYDGTVYFASVDGYLYAFRGTSPLANSPWPKFHHDLKNTGRVGGGR